MLRFRYVLALWFAIPQVAALSAEPVTQPKPIPASRPEIKQALEALKHREARLPLTIADPGASGSGRPLVNNARARAIYLPESWRTTGGRTDPNMSLDYPLKTKLFWIVSRGNNCHYCLGHQEHKLAAVGVTDDMLGLLDTDWSQFSAAEQAAMQLARKMTLEPHRISPADVKSLQPHYNDSQIVELIYTVASYNATNRWTDALGLPQDHAFRGESISFVPPTSKQFLRSRSIAAADPDRDRAAPASAEEARSAFESTRLRKPAVAIAEVDKPAGVGAATQSSGSPAWLRALDGFPEVANRQAKLFEALASDGDLDPQLKAELALCSARHNRAWYALAHAQARLRQFGVGDDGLADLYGDEPGDSDAKRQAFVFASKLTAAPWQVTDADIAGLQKHYSDRQVAQIVQVVCMANFFDRFTETLSLPLEPDVELFTQPE